LGMADVDVLLKPREAAAALMKATEVMIVRV
jgi:hypothetical protein